MSLCAILASSAFLSDLEAMPPPLPPVPVRAIEEPVEPAITINVTFLLNGSPAGEVPVETTTSGIASVDFDELVAKLRPTISQTFIDALTIRAAGRALVPVADLRTETFPIFFDVRALQLKADVPLDARALNQISITGRNEGLTESLVPSDFSFGVSVTLANRFQSRGDFFGRVDRDPFNLAAQGFVNIGGKDGAYLTFLTGIREGGRAFRSRTTLFHDDTDRAIRYSLGDIDPLSSGAFGNPLSIAGIGVERLYQTIQPYRNLRPAGRGGLILERPSRVEIFANGAIYRTIALGAGRYDLRDFPFLDGLNDVRVVVQDDTGRNETIGLSFFSDTELLEKGLSVFSANLGFRRDRFGQFASTRYSQSPTFSGLYQVGLNDRVTVGSSLQVSKRDTLITAVAVFGTLIGLFGLEGAIDRNSNEKLQASLLASYRLTRPRQNGREDRLDLDFQMRTARFSPLEPAGLSRERYRYDVTARYQTSLPYGVFGTIGAGYSKGRLLQRDLKNLNLGLTRSFNRLSVSTNYNYRSGSPSSDHRATMTLSLPLSARQYARASYDTARNRMGVDYTLQGFEGLNQTTAQASLTREDAGKAANFEVEHFSNRFRASVRHDYTRSQGQTEQNSDFAITTGFGYADGQWAVGRDPGRGFVIVKPHKTLRNSDVIASNQYSLGPVAKTGILGPALVPVQRVYQPDAVSVEVPNAPTGYDIGAGRIDILPGASSGYLWDIGSAASTTVVGRLTDAQGGPLSFVVGTLQPLGSTKANPVAFFTNRTGRLVAQNLSPGRYALVSDKGHTFGEITVPEEGDSMIDIGVLIVKDR